jgi:hypothetical protein
VEGGVSVLGERPVSGEPSGGHRPDNVAVRIAIGKWLQHLVTMVIETLLISDLFLFVDVAESAWNLEVEDKLVKQIQAFVG